VGPETTRNTIRLIGKTRVTGGLQTVFHGISPHEAPIHILEDDMTNKTVAAIATAALLGLAPLAANAHGGHRDCDDRGHRHQVHHHHHHHSHHGHHGRGYDDDRYGHRGYRAPVVVYPAPVAVYPAPRVAHVHVPPVVVPFPHLSVRIGF